MARRIFQTGDPVPWFVCRSTANAQYHFNTAGGRYIVLSFFGSAAHERMAGVLRYATTELRRHFNDEKVAFFGVSIDPEDEKQGRVQQMLPGFRYFLDTNRLVSLAYGAIDPQEKLPNGGVPYHAFTLVIDPLMRVLRVISMEDAAQHNRELAQVLSALPPVDDHAGVPVVAPVLVLPRVFEPEFCRELIQIYEKQGGNESGFMREKDGNTVGVMDYGFKRRKDFHFEEQPEFEYLRKAARERIEKRLLPEIKKAFQFEVTHIERYIVACYEGEVGGFFRMHRDNTTKGTAHRRFACTMNLNAEEYEGGDLRVPEFGTRTYRAPTGGVVIFSCSLLHEATPVTRGKRYAFLPFFYDISGAKIREENLKFLTGEMIDKNKSASA